MTLIHIELHTHITYLPKYNNTIFFPNSSTAKLRLTLKLQRKKTCSASRANVSLSAMARWMNEITQLLRNF